MRPAAPTPATKRLRPAPPERRAAAAVIDAVVWLAVPGAWATLLATVGAPAVVTVAVLLPVAVLGTLLAGLVTGVDGRSPGRLVAGLRLLGPDGRPIGVRAGVRRSALKAFAGLGTCGVLWLRWGAYGLADPRGAGRTPLDVRCGSVVVDLRTEPLSGPVAPAVPTGPVNLTAQRLAVPDEPAPGQVPALRVPAQRTPTLPEPDPGGWRLVADTGDSVRLEGSALLGRDPSPLPGVRHLVTLPSDGSLSRSHVRIGPVADGRLVLLDDSSTNGTVVVRGGSPQPVLQGQAVPLLEGDRVQVGDRSVTVHRDTRVGKR